MLEDIDKAAAQLQDKGAGWVTRRDGADALGRTAARALAALNAHKDDSDVDVRMAVERALGQASAGLAGVAPEPGAAKKTYSLEELARTCEKPGQRAVKPHKDGFVVEVQLKGGRRQLVHIMPGEREGVALIRVFTYCGEPSENTLEWALRTNMRLTQCALAICEEEGKRQLVLANCYIASETTPPEIKVSVKEIAHYGDWIERKLTGRDES